MTTGQCLCGAVRFEAAEVADEVQACHCNECQRWTGGGPLYAVRAKGVTVTGEENIQAYHHSAHGERAVCRICGTTLYWKLQGRGIAFLALGVLDDRSGKRLTEEIFIDHRPDWMPAIAGAKQSTEAEMKAQLDAFLAKESQS